MSAAVDEVELLSLWTLVAGVVLTAASGLAVVGGRLMNAASDARVARLKAIYAPLIARALDGDPAAFAALGRTPVHQRMALARLLVFPLVHDRRADHIAIARTLLQTLELVPVADRWLRSRWWWRRANALHVFGLVQYGERASQIVAALDDPHAGVRSAALDAIADLKDPATLSAVLVRFLQPTLERGRLKQVLAAFGSQCEPLLLDLARLRPEHRLQYARALTICGTSRSRPLLREWTSDPRPEVRAAACEALACVGLDDDTAPSIVTALDDEDVQVRVMAARALRNWPVTADTAARLARRLDDAWPVALNAARTLASGGPAGRRVLEAQTGIGSVGYALARQMLWEAEARA